MIHFVAVIGPSAVGKSTIKKKLGYQTVITWTSRKPRNGEQHGVDYFFASRDEMQKRMESGYFLEMTEYDGNYYATSVESLNQVINDRRCVSVAVDLNGIQELKKHFGKEVLTLGLYISRDSCRSRLESRNEGGVEERLANYEEEIEGLLKYSDMIVNNEEENWDRIPWIMDGVRTMVRDSVNS